MLLLSFGSFLFYGLNHNILLKGLEHHAVADWLVGVKNTEKMLYG